ncbi:hypothetical protein ACF0H5_010750 [Mactra antiquata]
MASSPRMDGIMSSSLSVTSPRVDNVMSSSMSSALDKRKVVDQRRLWEDDLGTVNVPSLYNRMNFATVPRKSPNKKTW